MADIRPRPRPRKPSGPRPQATPDSNPGNRGQSPSAAMVARQGARKRRLLEASGAEQDRQIDKYNSIEIDRIKVNKRTGGKTEAFARAAMARTSDEASAKARKGAAKTSAKLTAQVQIMKHRKRLSKNVENRRPK